MLPIHPTPAECYALEAAAAALDPSTPSNDDELDARTADVALSLVRVGVRALSAIPELADLPLARALSVGGMHDAGPALELALDRPSRPCGFEPTAAGAAALDDALAGEEVSERELELALEEIGRRLRVLETWPIAPGPGVHLGPDGHEWIRDEAGGITHSAARCHLCGSREAAADAEQDARDMGPDLGGRPGKMGFAR